MKIKRQGAMMNLLSNKSKSTVKDRKQNKNRNGMQMKN